MSTKCAKCGFMFDIPAYVIKPKSAAAGFLTSTTVTTIGRPACPKCLQEIYPEQ